LPGTNLRLTPERISLLLTVGAGLIGAAFLLAAWRRRRRHASSSPRRHGETPVGEESA
jgi:hypothetical protein